MKNLRALLSLSLLLPLAACSAGEEDSAAPSAVTTTVVHSANAPAGDDAADDVASGAAPGASGTAPAPASSTIPPLPEGACATSQLSAEIANVGLLDAAACQPQDADGLRIYPPENTDSLYVAVPGLQGCAGEVDILSVQPITELSP
ncbi:hypothetical protein [Corynebacterium sp. HMSC034H07]|uniref:hypothetical protein n=1 Tax=Corynebacterium sp. HMSC034H07 TaxID=1739512 RepID=UPI0008A40D90|nr:hypothetical protein [Corynebacterium sp. HMSC034H07]OFO96428.1 hypothetical protein HMPREF3009_05735 [Corynebacterium sp. HMSC034H07]